MMPIVFINCKDLPFVDEILLGTKQYETRTRNMLGRFLGEKILIAETGSGRPVIRGSARISQVISVSTREDWENYRIEACIPAGSKYDWQPDTQKKWLYKLTEVVIYNPFTAPEGRRHGRTWMEYA